MSRNSEFLSYLFKDQSTKAKILDLEVFQYALSFAIIKKEGQNFLCDANARVSRGPSHKYSLSEILNFENDPCILANN